jgi:hypothetical protein
MKCGLFRTGSRASSDLAIHAKMYTKLQKRVKGCTIPILADISALVRDGGIVGGHHSCNNYWPENGTVDRIATRRLRHLGSFAACNPRGL